MKRLFVIGPGENQQTYYGLTYSPARYTIDYNRVAEGNKSFLTAGVFMWHEPRGAWRRAFGCKNSTSSFPQFEREMEERLRLFVEGER